MSFSPFARFRNFTLENLKALLDVYPDMAKQFSWGEAGDIVESESKGYKKTAYQQACQFGIEDRSCDSFRVQSYLYTLDDKMLLKFLEFWMKTYFAPNPYVNSDDQPFILYCELGKEILTQKSLRIDYYDFFNRRIGGKSDDILMNAFRAFCKPIKYEKIGDKHYFYVEDGYVSDLNQEILFIEKEFPVINQKDRKAFFDRYSYEKFCKFHGITAIKPVEDDSFSSRVKKFRKADNILLYGVPGCGKSHTIKTQYCDDDNYMERAVFHPDYTYSDFIGQILPKVTDHKVSYEFGPGPFTRILKKAADPENKDNYYYLVIEEINRGNAPAIFGDVFQLLDRDSNGVSEYGVSNEAVAEVVYGDKDHKVKIPSNLFILATMNSSDQNVFTLDTAFKRRWKMKLIENDIDACKYASHPVCGSSVTWAAFAKRINDLIIEVKTDNLSNEDNRLGAYFVSESELDDADAFGEKVLMYLWNDAFKYDHEKVFKTQYRTLDELIKGFKDTGFSVFADNVKFPESTEDDDEAIDFTLDSGSGEIQIERYLSGKKDHLIEYYKRLLDVVKKDVPDLRDATVGSLQYASWRAPGLSKVSFADIKIRKDRIVIFTEQPSGDSLQDIGEVLPVNNHRNHYFKIIYTGDRTDDVASAIVESYEKLKVN